MSQSSPLAVLVALAALVATGAGIPVTVAAQQQNRDAIETLQIRPDVYVLSVAGRNVGMQIGEDGAIVVDTGAAVNAEALLSAIRKITDRPIRYVINTSSDPESVGGNAKIAVAGQWFLRTGANLVGGIAANNSAAIISTEQVLNAMSAGEAYPSSAWPTDTFTRRRKSLFLNGQGIEVTHEPNAHSDGDATVFFRRSDVVMTGSIVDLDSFPVIDVKRGGSVDGEIAALNRLVELAIPSIPLPFKEGGTLVVPGRGRIGEQAELVEYRDMVTIIRDRVQSLIGAGKTLSEIKAANPTQGYRGRYGSNAGAWTTDAFIDALYASMTTRQAK